MNVHRSWVRDLQWCHSAPFQLVSAGDRVVFLGFDAVTRSIPSLDANRRVNNALVRTPWQQVSLSVLQTVELGGRLAHKLFLSRDGHNAVAVLSSASHLRLKLIQNVDSA